MTIPGSNTNPTWPVSPDGSGNVAALSWNLAQTIRNAGGSDGLIQVELCSYASPTAPSPTACSPPANVQLAAHAFGASYASEKAGPGQVSLLTGDYQISASDAQVPTATGSLSVGRSITTADPTGETGNTLPANIHNVESDLSSFAATNSTVASATSPTVLGADSLQSAPTASGSSSDTFASVGGDSGALRLGLAGGHTYTFTAREYVPAGTGLTPDNTTRGERPVALTRVGSGSYGVTAGTTPTATNAWQVVSVTFWVPEGSTEAFIRLYNGFAQGKPTDTIFYDDLTLVQDGIFGPGWTSDLPGPTAGDADLTLQDDTSQGYVVMTGADGSEDDYQATSSISTYPISYQGLGDAGDGSVLAKVSATSFTLTDPDGTVTTYTTSDGGHTWPTQSVVEPGSATSTTYTHDGDGRVTQIVGPAPAGVICTTSPLTTAGCRTLTLNYAAATTAAGTTPAGWGDVAGSLKTVSFTAADPTHANTMTTAAVAAYSYDNTGLLRATWDPRITPALQTTYSYTPDGRLASVVPPGLNGYSFSYDTAGRLTGVARPNPAGGTDTTTIVYGVPVTGTVGGVTAPVELGGATTAAWGQTTDLPAYAAAVFPASYVPAGTTPATVAGADWPYATLHYLDVNGREVNTATYGAGAWQVAATGYDNHGNTIWQLGALARAEALTPSSYPNLDPYVASITTSAADRANLLATINTYSADGTELLDTVDPTHPVTLPDGTTVDARDHTHTTYDEGAPNSDLAADGGPYRLATTITTAAQTADGVDHDTRTTHNGYAAMVAGDPDGWTLRQATTKTTVMGGSNPDLVTTTRYDNEGRTIETRLPAGPAGGDAHTTLTTYYTATGTGPCANPGEAGLVCQTGPAAQPTTGPTTPTTTTTSYTMWGDPTQVVDASGTATRTTTTIYDNGERACVKTTTTSGTGDTALPATYTGYDPTTGLATLTGNISGIPPTVCPTSTPTVSSSIATGYDNDGRTNSYTDADGVTSTTTYTPDGQPATANDGKGSVTYSYDTATDHRQLLTALTDSQAGTFTATYDADGNLAGETYPNGLAATRSYNDQGQTTGLTYTMGVTTWMAFTAQYSAHDQIANQTSSDPAAAFPVGSAQTYGYDNDGRLTTVADEDQTATPAVCTTRVYTYDADSNRTALAAYPPDSTGNCTTTTSPVTTTHSYDQADRLAVASGYNYDPLGRTTTVPAADASRHQPHRRLLQQRHGGQPNPRNRRQNLQPRPRSADPIHHHLHHRRHRNRPLRRQHRQPSLASRIRPQLDPQHPSPRRQPGRHRHQHRQRRTPTRQHPQRHRRHHPQHHHRHRDRQLLRIHRIRRTPHHQHRPPPATAGSAPNAATPATPSPASSSWANASTTPPPPTSSKATPSPEAPPTTTTTATKTPSTAPTSTANGDGTTGGTQRGTPHAPSTGTPT